MRPCSLSCCIRALLAAAAILCVAAAVEGSPPALFGGARSDDPYPTRFMSIDPATGAGTNVGTSVGPGYDGFQGLAYDPLTDFLYALLRDWSPGPAWWLARIDRQTGLATKVGELGAEVGWGPFGLAISVNGVLYTSLPYTDHSLRTIDKTTGAVSPPLGFLTTLVTGLAFDRAGTLFGVDYDHNALLTIDPANASILSSTPASGPLTMALGLTWHDGLLWGAGGGWNSMLVSIDPLTAAVTIVGPTNQPHVQALTDYAPRPVGSEPRTWTTVKTLYR